MPNSTAAPIAWRGCCASVGVGPQVRVGLALERSLEMVVGLLAILKAGGAYVPLDPEYPLDRLHYMIEDRRWLAAQ
jgi:non-ribosomal peptide synthetase component F